MMLYYCTIVAQLFRGSPGTHGTILLLWVGLLACIRSLRALDLIAATCRNKFCSLAFLTYEKMILVECGSAEAPRHLGKRCFNSLPRLCSAQCAAAGLVSFRIS